MSRPLRIEYPGAVYHVTSRGNRGEAIFLDHKDRNGFLGIIAGTIDRFQWRCHAYCLMGNHYHFLVETPLPNLGRGMRRVNGVYTQRFNRVHGREGHVFQGRYKAILVEKEAHLLEISRYVALNPVRAGMVKRVEDWPWSSYGATVGDCPAPPWLKTDWLLSCFGKARPSEAYRRFVAEGLGAKNPWDGLAGRDVLGGEDFLAEVQVKTGMKDREIPRQKRHLARPTLAQLQNRHEDRAQWMASACREHGYTMGEIAAEAGLHYSSVSKIIKVWEKENGVRS